MRYLGLSVVLLLALIAGLAAYCWQNDSPRYSLLTDQLGLVYEIDHQTGRTWRFQGTEKIEVKVADVWEKMTVPPELYSEILIHLTPYQDPARTPFYRLKGHIFNGTDWNLTEMTLLLTVQPRDGESWSRKIRNEVYVRVHSNGVVPIDILESELPRSFEVQIVKVVGYPPPLIRDETQYDEARKELEELHSKLNNLDPDVPLSANGIERAELRNAVSRLQQQLAVYEGRCDDEWRERTGLTR